jgi:hypothetical protein
MTNWKRTTAWVLATLTIIIALSGAAWTAFGTSEVALSESEIQSKIDSTMPFEVKEDITLSEVKVDLSGDKINLQFKASATKYGTTYNLAVHTTADLEYRSGEGKFFFHPSLVQIDSLSANGGPAVEKATALLEKWVNPEHGQREELLAKAKTLLNAGVQKAVEATLNRVPVYTLKDDLKGSVARLAIESVEIKNGSVIAHLSLWQLSKMVLVYLALGVIGILAALGLALNPELFLATVFLGAINGS